MATNGVSAETPATIEPKTEPKTELKAEPKIEAKVETKIETKTEADTGAGDAPERTPDHAKLLENKLSVEVANKLDDIFKTGLLLNVLLRTRHVVICSHFLLFLGKLTIAELDERAFEALKEFPTDGALTVLDLFVDSQLDHVSNKSAYLCGMMKTHKQKQKLSTTNSNPSAPKGPDEEKIKVMNRLHVSC